MKTIVDFNQAIQLKPDYVDAFNNRSVAYKRKGDMDKAKVNFEKAHELDPSKYPVANGLNR